MKTNHSSAGKCCQINLFKSNLTKARVVSLHVNIYNVSGFMPFIFEPILP